MKDFFTQCMKDLYALTGIEQVRWMQNDLTNGKRDFEICVEAMTETAKQFPYIPEEDQKRIVLRMMKEDRNYKSLNARTVWGWLNLHKDVHYRGQTHFTDDTTQAAPPEVADKYVQEILENLKKVGNPEYMDGLKQIRIEKGFVKDFVDRNKEAQHQEWQKENFDEMGFKKDCYTDEAEWREMKGYKKILTQGTSKFSESELTPEP